MVRKPGKLKGEVWSVEYEKEYGFDTVELQKSVIQPNSFVLIVDDLLATGGSMRAAIDLVSKVPNVTIDCFTLLKVDSLYEKACDKLAPYDVTVLMDHAE